MASLGLINLIIEAGPSWPLVLPGLISSSKGQITKDTVGSTVIQAIVNNFRIYPGCESD